MGFEDFDWTPGCIIIGAQVGIYSWGWAWFPGIQWDLFVNITDWVLSKNFEVGIYYGHWLVFGLDEDEDEDEDDDDDDDD